MEWFADPSAWIALLTLTFLEIVLGIDNIVFISVLTNRLPVEKRDKTRFTGLAVAMISRILLVFTLSWIIGLTKPLFTAFDTAVSWKDMIMIAGGLFLLTKSTLEIHHSLEAHQEEQEEPKQVTVKSVLLQVLVLDIVFSLDSVITAVGMVPHVSVMVIAIVVSVGVMMVAAKPISNFIEEHPTFKMLALSFLLLIGVTLIGEGFHFHIPKGYLYFAMAFSTFVEVLNMKIYKSKKSHTLLRAPAVKK